MKASVTSLPAPVGGWNARDALSDMPITDAVSMTNWYPNTTDIQVRKGYTSYATGMTNEVETLMPYNSLTGTNKFFAAAGTSIWDISAAGAASTSVSGLTNARWQYVNMETAGGNFLLAVNGADKPLLYNGTTWATMDSTTTAATAVTDGTTVTVTAANTYIVGQTVTTAGFNASFNGDFVVASVIGPAGAQTGFTYALVAAGPVGGPGTVISKQAITGLTASSLIHIHLHKFRVWMVQKDTLDLWYLGTSSISGAATKFPLEGVAQMGGYVMAIGTWTIDAGYGVDDHFVIVTSKGEVIVYRGTDPSSATTWALVGVWQMGSPVGRRCLTKYMGDILLISQDGLMPLASALQSSRLQPRVSLTDKITKAVSEAVSSYGSNFGWEAQTFPKNNQLVLNVPVSTGSQEQYVMNTITKQWCRFTGMGANTFELFNDDLYFGSTGTVYKYWDGYSDNGGNITADVQQAFTYLKTPGRIKRFMSMQAMIQTDGNPAIQAGVNVDFDTSTPLANLPVPPAASPSSWDTASWDTAVWGGSLQISKQWQGVTGQGVAVAPHYLLISSDTDTHLMSTTLTYEVGGVV